MVRTYRDLTAWQKAFELSRQVYRVTRSFPREELYGLTSQMRRAAVSIPSNIAEGCGRKSTAEYVQMLHIAYGSNCELETQLLLAKDLGYLDVAAAEESLALSAEVERLISALIRALKAKLASPVRR